jgi:L-ascorbate metabolism protein UlaG (beta-lactamase superfamily)
VNGTGDGNLAPAWGQVALWWLGQSGFGLRGNSATLVVDPFLADHPDRLVPPPFRPHQVGGLDAVVVTHDHLDHLDEESLLGLAEASPDAQFVVPEPLVERVVDLGIPSERVAGAQPDRPFELDGLTVHPVPASHGDDLEDGYGFGLEQSNGLYRYLGYVFDLGGVRVYHAGDTIPYEGMEDRLRDLGVDVALLPINGRDAEREGKGIVGNLDEEEAAQLAAAIGADLLVPMHYDMFAWNPGSPERLVELARTRHPELQILVASLARRFVYTNPAPKR